MKQILFHLTLALGAFSCFSQSPGVRNGHAMVYSMPLHAILLFGGADEGKVYGDTWIFSNGKWENLPAAGPSPRTFPCLVMADNYILLFGGNAVLFGNEKNPVHYLDDTWKFQDGRWKKINLDVHPGPRAEAAIAYDPIRKKVVLFGGRQAGEKWVAGDTWEFDGDAWERMEEKDFPTPRSGAGMIYDPLHKRIVLSGGNPVISRQKDYNGPMWSWDGAKWSPINSSIPLVFNACMAYSTRENFILRFGGWNGSERNNDTWIYQNEEWEKLSLKNSPAARNHSIMVYDPGQNTFFLFGGHDGENVFGDMWQFKDKIWTLVYEESSRRRLENGH